MSKRTLPMTGGCMCGAVRFQAYGNTSWIGICHCASCRRYTGGVLNAAAGFPAASVRFDGDLRTYNSSPGVQRYFCCLCGSSIAFQSKQWAEDIHLFVGTFDDCETLKPEFHIFAEERLGWLVIADQLPKYKTTPAAGDLIEDWS